MLPKLLLTCAIASLIAASGCTLTLDDPGATARAIALTAVAVPSPTRIAPARTATLAKPTATPISPTAAPLAALTATLVPDAEMCRGGDRVVALLVEASLLTGIHAGLEQFAGDLCREGYTVLRKSSGLGTPTDVRSYLGRLYTQTNRRLAGAILIGNLPYAYQWVTLHSSNPQIPSTSEEVISFQYYGDLDGSFSASPGFKSPGQHPHSYDVHGGDVNWEIWIGVLPRYKGDHANSVDAIKRYFAKNHSYRTGQPKPPRAFLEVSEHFRSTGAAQDTEFLNSLRSGQFSWKPFSDSSSAHLYFDTPTPNLSLARGYANLSAGAADFAVLDAHGSWRASGRLDTQWAESSPVRTIFFWSNGCAVGNLSYPDNFLSAVLYSPTSMVLVAKGTTNDSGGMGNNQTGFFGANIASAMSRGETFGQAILSHVNVPLISPWAASREFHFATAIILGDPTLRLRP